MSLGSKNALRSLRPYNLRLALLIQCVTWQFHVSFESKITPSTFIDFSDVMITFSSLILTVGGSFLWNKQISVLPTVKLVFLECSLKYLIFSEIVF